ncbi:MAG: HAMP domain-containing histidine kinase [Clostridiales bacterium]|nr:HAMP domain-containing histidine kinase [Clostridiales bacterium]
MDFHLLSLIALCIMLFLVLFLYAKLRRVRGQIVIIEEALEDIKSGNLNRRMLAQRNDMTRKICYDINDIVINSQMQFIKQKQSEQAYKRLMTSISHDVKTPLASLVGYLDAIECRIIAEEEKDNYVHVAYEKAHYLKHFIESLFEWVKLDSGEQIFHFELLDLNELSRNIVGDWITVLESNHFDYECDIPETEWLIRIDSNAYGRILNNLFQNILIHSKGSKMTLHIFEDDVQVQITITDNGRGIDPEHLPHIFERMYQCDPSRSAKGNGLGLSIVKELVAAHKGTISVDSTPDNGTAFTISFPRTL